MKNNERLCSTESDLKRLSDETGRLARLKILCELK